MWMFMGVMVVSMTQNKKVVTNLNDMDAEEQLKEPKPAGLYNNLLGRELFEYCEPF
jgi:hypothetical protein